MWNGRSPSSMASVLLLPDSALLALVSVEVNEEEKMITATARTTSREAACPLCQHPAHRIQSNYVRVLADLPCSGQRVRWLIQVRRFWCPNTQCKRVIFTERLPTCAPASARRTIQQAELLCEVAFALGGKAGERIAQLLSMATSHDTLLRLMRRSPPPVVTTPRILGLDDFAWKKGDRYGTLLIDQEEHKVVDILPDREAETVTTWLLEHPGVEVISRDRAGAYAEGARRGAPQARQIADRFHLLVNLQTAMIRFFERKHECLTRLAAEQLAAQDSASPASQREQSSEEEGEQKPLTKTGIQQQARREKRKSRYDEVMKLHEQGVSQMAIATMLNLHRDTVRRYITASAFPEIVRPHRRSKLDPYKDYLHQRLGEGEQNVTHLIAEVRAQGYLGGDTIIFDYLRSLQDAPSWMETYHQAKQRKARGTPGTPLSARTAAWLFVCNPRKLKLRQVWQLEPLRVGDEELAQAYQLVQDFRTMVTQRQVAFLGRWLKEAQESGIPELRSLAAGIYRDYEAVYGALETSYSNDHVA
jgi:transposase